MASCLRSRPVKDAKQGDYTDSCTMQRCALRDCESGRVYNPVISPARRLPAIETIGSECGYLYCILSGRTSQCQPAVLCLRYQASPNSSPKLGIICCFCGTFLIVLKYQGHDVACKSFIYSRMPVFSHCL